MKHFNILAAILLFLVSGQKMCAQTEHGFKEMDIANDFAIILLPFLLTLLFSQLLTLQAMVTTP